METLVQALLIGTVWFIALQIKTLDGFFVCYPNTTIVVGNPDPVWYDTVHASEDSTLRNCSAVIAGRDAVITGCTWNEVIKVNFSKRGVIGKFHEMLLICADIPEGGVRATVANQFFPKLSIIHLPAATLVTEVSVYSDIKDNAGRSVSSAFIGQNIYLHIRGPGSMDVMPTMCFAFPGYVNINSDDPNRKHLTEDGCSQDVTVIDNFQFSTDQSEVTARIITFRFLYSDTVTVWCKVTVCSRTDPTCDMVCPTYRRRRSFKDSEDLEFTSTTHSSVRVLNPSAEDPQGLSSMFGATNRQGVSVALFAISVLLAVYHTKDRE